MAHLGHWHLRSDGQTHFRRVNLPWNRVGKVAVFHWRLSMDQYSLRQFVIFGERHLRYLIKEFMKHYHTERFHQGLGGQLIKGKPGSANDNGSNGSIVRRSRLGGLLNYYQREAA